MDSLDKQLEAVIERALPELRVAARAILSGEAAHAFEFGKAGNSKTGESKRIVLFLAWEDCANLIEKALSSDPGLKVFRMKEERPH